MDIVVYTKSDCPACINAKHLLNKNDYQFTEKTIGENITREEVMSLFPHVRTVPIIVIDNKVIGGFKELDLIVKANQ